MSYFCQSVILFVCRNSVGVSGSTQPESQRCKHKINNDSNKRDMIIEDEWLNQIQICRNLSNNWMPWYLFVQRGKHSSIDDDACEGKINRWVR